MLSRRKIRKKMLISAVVMLALRKKTDFNLAEKTSSPNYFPSFVPTPSSRYNTFIIHNLFNLNDDFVVSKVLTRYYFIMSPTGAGMIAND